MQNGNPAARLLDVLNETLAVQKNIPTRQAWGQVLKSRDNQALMYDRLAKLMLLSEETSELVNSLFPRQLRATTAWKTALDTAFTSQNMHATIDSFQNHITNTAIDHLTSAVDLIDLKNPTILNANDIADFTQKLNDLISEVLNGEFEDKVQEYLVRSLRKVIIALDEYRLSGSIPVTTSIESMLGHSFFDRDYGNALNETETGSKILTILGGIADAVTVATPIAPLLFSETVKKMLGVF